MAFQDSPIIGGAVALAMNDAYTALTLLLAMRQKLRHEQARLLARAAMKIELGLDAVLAPLKLAHHAVLNAFAAIKQDFSGLQQGGFLIGR